MSDNWIPMHLHSSCSNSILMDSPNNYEDYIEYAKENGFKGLVFTEHSHSASWFNKKKALEKNGYKYVHASEVYITSSREADNSFHLCIYGLNNKGRLEVNQLISNAYKRDRSFYRRPRVMIGDLINCKNIAVATACLASPLAKDIDGEVSKKLLEWGLKNKDRFFLEIQPHNHIDQIVYNKKLIELSRQHGYNLIASNDIHYTTKEMGEVRAKMQKSKGINFSDEDSFDLSMKSYDEMLLGFIKQGINEEDAKSALANTNVLYDMAEEYELDKSFKFPKLYNNSINEISNRCIESFKDKGFYGNKEYADRLIEELSVLRHLKSEDYMLLLSDWQRDNKKNSLLSAPSRGCFTKDSIIHTKLEMKTIDNICVGDEVITEKGEWKKVLKTFEYNINEPMIEFEYQLQGSSYKKYKNICTLDHKILTNNGWKESKDLKVGDLLCSPKLNKFKNKDIIIDLNNYNDFNFEYDEEFIYEEIPTNNSYKGSPRDLVKQGIIPNKVFAQRMIKCGESSRPKSKERIKNILKYIGMDNTEQYIEYCKKNGKNRNKIKRFIKLDYSMNKFISMMYGDGFTSRNSSIALAINNTTKAIENKKCMLDFCDAVNYDKDKIYYNHASDGRNLVQCYINSKILSNWFMKDFFKSKFKKDKIFNIRLLDQNKSCIEGLYQGFIISDGSIGSGKLSFDSTSKSLISAFKILNNMLGYEPLAFDVRLAHTDRRGYNSKEAYKVRRPLNRVNVIKDDYNYWYVPITKIIKHDKFEGMVYDMEIEDTHSYVINNVCVHNSASGSLIAYLLDITEIDSIKWKMNFSRFMNKTRISMPDIDLDYSPNDRESVKDWFYKHNTLHASDIITFGTEQEKGAIDMMGRAFNVPLSEVSSIKDNITNSRASDRYKELFEYVDATIGCITKIGRHAGGVLVSDLDIEKELGLITITDKTVDSGHRIVSQLNMKELEDYGYIKVDVLGLSTQGALNRVEKYLGESKLDPNKSNLNDQTVYDAFHESPCCVFQFEGEQAWKYLSKALKNNKGKMDNFEIFSLTSGMLRPCADSVRDDYFNGKSFDSGIEEINNHFKETNGYYIFQEQIMDYLVQFCGFDGVESDNIRRIISKGVYNSDMQIKFDNSMADIKSRFITNMRNKGHDDAIINIALDKFTTVVTDSQNYAFSKNHSHPYTFISYKSLYYRTYYKKEFITACLNEFKDDKNKMKEILNYVKLHSNIKIMPPVFGKAIMEYAYDENEDIIYEGLFGAKGLSKTSEFELDKLKNINFNNFLDMIIYIKDNKIKLSPTDITILVSLDFFKVFGGQKYLLSIVEAAMYTDSKLKYDPDKVISIEKNITKINLALPFIKNNYDNILEFIVDIIDNKIKLGQKEIKLILDMGIISCDFKDVNDFLKIVMDSKSKVKYTYVKTEKTRLTKLENVKSVLNGIYPEIFNLPVSKILNNEINAKKYISRDLTNYVNGLSNEDSSEITKAVNELRIVGHTGRLFSNMEKEFLYILEEKNPYSDYIIRAFSLKTGEVKTYKCKKENMLAEKDQLIVVNKTYEKEASIRIEIDGQMKWKKSGVFNTFIDSMSIVQI